MNTRDDTGIFIFAQQTDGKVAGVSYELLGKAKELARKLKTKVTAILLGYHISDLCENLAAYGADQVIMVDRKDLELYSTRPYTYCICQIVKAYKPEIVLFGATAVGRDLAPRVAARISTGLTADCTGLELANDGTKNLRMIRPAFGGNLLATIVCPNSRPQMATVRPGVLKKPSPKKGVSVLVDRLDLEIPDAEKDVEILKVRKKEPEKEEVQNAKIVVSGGRGMGGEENFKMLEELAQALGGTVGASRACVDAGWVAQDLQIGQTGKKVHPKLYLACGISGAVQHLVGMEESDVIMAIDKDENAPIFKVADFGIVGDALEIIPLLTAAVKKAMNTGE
ncbi:MAG: electron transfer flavoprotein subunit alpha/FixB family protein [Oscillospiraceae bacterium]|jgi:electron transfer flavoprotein alpha subunit|nr:electron transfer flavoprotein subunit alpha/FixB family protein [Oscillospiraceae bacterium]